MRTAYTLSLIVSSVFILVLMIKQIFTHTWVSNDWYYLIISLLWIGFLIWRLLKRNELP